MRPGQPPLTAPVDEHLRVHLRSEEQLLGVEVLVSDVTLRQTPRTADDAGQPPFPVPGEVGRGAEARRRRIEPDLAETTCERGHRGMLERQVERREVDLAELPREAG